ncbi:Hypothetical_protein [Hexamita inflata]|uniref:Hypothetical_protein n=1 Tax=Hexamita inflata TaxID=28002 RepID=A0AA86UF07_9EUKA|nr:Hypothetical protein HINF_LOCUS36197 [Hexamita inflata]
MQFYTHKLLPKDKNNSWYQIYSSIHNLVQNLMYKTNIHFHYHLQVLDTMCKYQMLFQWNHISLNTHYNHKIQINNRQFIMHYLSASVIVPCSKILSKECYKFEFEILLNWKSLQLSSQLLQAVLSLLTQSILCDQVHNEHFLLFYNKSILKCEVYNQKISSMWLNMQQYQIQKESIQLSLLEEINAFFPWQLRSRDPSIYIQYMQTYTRICKKQNDRRKALRAFRFQKSQQVILFVPK